MEGQRHNKTANTTLCLAEPMQQTKNFDCWFAATTMKYVEDPAVLLGTDKMQILRKNSSTHIHLAFQFLQHGEPYSNDYEVSRYSAKSHICFSN